MLSVESHHGRTIVGSLDRGEDLIEGLRALCAVHKIRGGVVTAIGALEKAEVTHYLPEKRAYGQSRALKGPLEILSLQGNLSESDGDLSIHLHVTLSREGDNGVEVLGGHLLSGRVFACELTILALDDVLLRRAPEPDTGLRLWNQGFEMGPDGKGRAVEPMSMETDRTPGEDAVSPDRDTARQGGVPREAVSGSTPRAKPVARAAATPTDEPEVREEIGESRRAADGEETGPTHAGSITARRTPRPKVWEEVAAASAAAQREPAELPIRPDREARGTEEEPPEDEEGDAPDADYVDLVPGDVIEHPKFGHCRVERVEGEEEYVHVRLRNRNLVRLSLDVITLELIGSEGGHQVFKARIG